MALEDLTGASKFLGALVATNPVATDDRREGDDHIRGVKNVLKNTFPSLNAAWTGLSISGGVLTTGLPLQAPAGSAAAPAYSFDTAPDIGMFRASATALGFATAGVQRMAIGAAGISATLPFVQADGTLAAPAYSFSNSTGTGLYSPAVNEIAVSVNGSRRWRVNSDVDVCTLVRSNPPVVANMVNAEIAFSRISDTSLRVSMRGTDGTLRSATLTLA